MVARKYLRYSLLGGVVIGAVIAGVTAYLLWASLPSQDRTIRMQRLSAPVQVAFDALGIPRIHSRNREDAFRALGFVTARDRLFQMDLLRRNASGRMAEILGPDLIDSDRRHRIFGFEQVASAIFTVLPDAQRRVLRAYTEGVNQAIIQAEVLPFEFLMLGYAPETWRVEDSIVVVLGMHEGLSYGEQERTTTVMRAVLPNTVVEFLTPKTDPYTQRLSPINTPPSVHLLPVRELVTLLQPRSTASHPPRFEYRSKLQRGSNAWVVAPSKTRDGGAILANDMHWGLGVPNIWYRAELHYGDVQITGLTLPGVPLILVGSNRHIAWGFTGGGPDVTDLVLVNINPRDPAEYQTPQGMRRFAERIETIHVRGAEAQSIIVRTTQWGPVLAEPLIGKPVAVRWTGLDPGATNLDYMDLDQVRTVEAVLPKLTRAGGPPLNALIADAHGNIGWTVSGRIPVRIGMDGTYSHSWADGRHGWERYLAPDEVPRIVNPPSGFLVNANQRMMGSLDADPLGHNYAPGYRAYRITERLQQMKQISEDDMLGLQLDTQADVFRYYQQLALKVLAIEDAKGRSDAAALRRYLEAWDGRAEQGSVGLELLTEFREALMDAVLTPILARCREVDPNFNYSWNYADVPLQRLLDANLRELLPAGETYPSWDALVRAILEQTAERLRARYHVDRLEALDWGRTSKAHIVHPLSGALPLIGHLLDMPSEPLAGCLECVRAFDGENGATERLVVSPGREEKGILHMPTGQSGHPLSAHYRDQHMSWTQGRPLPFLAGPVQHRLTLKPASLATPVN